MLYIEPGKLRAALSIAPKDDIRYYLKGVLLERTANRDSGVGGDIHIVSTDGHRMFCGVLPLHECTQQGPWQLIVPYDTVKLALASKSKLLFLEALSDGRYALEGHIFTPIEGKFPDWRRVKPDTAKPVVADVQYNWGYINDACNALRFWYGSKKANYWFKSVANSTVNTNSAIGCMLGSDMTACVVVMPLREDSITCATPFNPSSYM